MSKKIECPSCGNIEYHENVKGIENSFELRGKYEGRPVIKCKRCNAGLRIGFLSFIFGGKPDLIQKDTWKFMDEEWNRHFSNKININDNITKKTKTCIVPSTCDQKYNQKKEKNIEVEDILNANDEAFYLAALYEIDNNQIQNQPLWVKCMALCDGDAEKSKYMYIRLRVPFIKSEYKKLLIKDAEKEIKDSLIHILLSDKRKLSNFLESRDMTFSYSATGRYYIFAKHKLIRTLENDEEVKEFLLSILY